LANLITDCLTMLLVQSLYVVGCRGNPALDEAGGCIGSWCAPPTFPDLLAAFAGSLGRSAAMRNLTVELMSPGSLASAPCRRLVDCCLPRTDFTAARRRPLCSAADQLPALPSCRSGHARDPVASGRNGPSQFSRSLEVEKI